MNVFVLYRYWDTPDNEGNEVCGVYKDVDNAISVMKKDAEHVKSYYQDDYLGRRYDLGGRTGNSSWT